MEEFIKQLKRLDKLATEEPWKQHYGFNNGGCPIAFFFIPGHNQNKKVAMLADDANLIVTLRNNLPKIIKFLEEGAIK